MSNRWICNIAMLCPSGHRTSAAAMASQMSQNPADNTPKFFSKEVGPIGSEEVSYYLAHSRMRELVLSQMPALAILFPGAKYLVTSHDEFPDAEYQTIEEWLLSMNLEMKEKE